MIASIAFGLVAGLASGMSAPSVPPPLPLSYQVTGREQGSSKAVVSFVQYAVDARVPFQQILLRPGGNSSYDFCDFDHAIHYEVTNDVDCVKTQSPCTLSLGDYFRRMQFAEYYAPCDRNAPPPPRSNSTYIPEGLSWWRSPSSSKLYAEYFCLATTTDSGKPQSVPVSVVLADKISDPVFKLEVTRFEVAPPQTVFETPTACLKV